MSEKENENEEKSLFRVFALPFRLNMSRSNSTVQNNKMQQQENAENKTKEVAKAEVATDKEEASSERKMSEIEQIEKVIELNMDEMYFLTIHEFSEYYEFNIYLSDHYDEDKLPPIRFVSESGVSALFEFIRNNKEVLSTGSLSDIQQKLRSDDELHDKFYSTIKTIITRELEYDNGRWKYREVKEKDDEDFLDYLVGYILNSYVFIFRMKMVAEILKEIDENNPDIGKVLFAYAKTAHILGMLTPALTTNSERRMKVYLSKLDKLLTGEEKPSVMYEAIASSIYKLQKEEKERFDEEMSKSNVYVPRYKRVVEIG